MHYEAPPLSSPSKPRVWSRNLSHLLPPYIYSYQTDGAIHMAFHSSLPPSLPFSLAPSP